MFPTDPKWQKVDPNMFIPGESSIMYDPRRDADRCDGQHPIISPVGRGLKGDSYRVRIVDITDPDYPDPLMHKADETYLIGEIFDEITKEWKPDPDWLDANGEYYNINGGQLWYKYNYRPVQPGEVGTFTISFKVTRPNRPTWSWTTQPIPYILTPDEIGNGTIGAGVATVYYNQGDYKDSSGWHTRKWEDELHYPETPWVRADFNPPDQPNDGRGVMTYVPYPDSHVWTVNLMAGAHGNMNVPSLDDIYNMLTNVLVYDPTQNVIVQITNPGDYLENGPIINVNVTRPSGYVWDSDMAVRGQTGNSNYPGTSYGGVRDNKLIIPPTETTTVDYVMLYTANNERRKMTYDDFMTSTGLEQIITNITTNVRKVTYAFNSLITWIADHLPFSATLVDLPDDPQYNTPPQGFLPDPLPANDNFAIGNINHYTAVSNPSQTNATSSHYIRANENAAAAYDSVEN